METHNPGVRGVLGRTASVIAADYEVLHSVMEKAWSQVVRAESAGAITFDLVAWRALPLSLKRSTLREAIHRLRRTLRNIDFVHVEDALTLAGRGQTGDQATLPANLMLTLSYDTFVVGSVEHTSPLPDQPWLEPGTTLDVNVPGQSRLPGSSWVIESREACPPQPQAALHVPPSGARVASPSEAFKFETIDPWESYLDADALEGPLVLRTRQAGDRLAPLGMDGHTKSLRDVFIHAKIPQAWRDRMPVLVAGSRIVWACGVRVSHEARVTPATRRVLHVRFVKMDGEESTTPPQAAGLVGKPASPS